MNSLLLFSGRRGTEQLAQRQQNLRLGYKNFFYCFPDTLVITHTVSRVGSSNFAMYSSVRRNLPSFSSEERPTDLAWMSPPPPAFPLPLVSFLHYAEIVPPGALHLLLLRQMLGPVRQLGGGGRRPVSKSCQAKNDL